jgi:hypothetical protein
VSIENILASVAIATAILIPVVVALWRHNATVANDLRKELGSIQALISDLQIKVGIANERIDSARRRLKTLEES